MAETYAQQLERLTQKMQSPPPATPAQTAATQDVLGQAQGSPRALIDLFNAITGGSEEQRLKPTGIITEGAPFMARLKASLPPDAKDQLTVLQTELEKAHGSPVQFRWDDTANALVYDTLGQQGEVTSTRMVDEPGMGAGDIADIAGEVPAIAAESIALGASALARKPVGASKARQVGRWIRHGLAAMTGAYTGEGTRIKMAEEAGAYPGQTPEQIGQEVHEEGMKAAGLSLAGTVVGGVGGMLFKSISNLVKGRVLPPEYLEVAQNLKGNADPYVTDINLFLENAGRPERLNPTTGELLNAGPILTQERRFLEQPHLGGQEAMLARKEQQRQALDAAAQQARADAGVDVPVPSALEIGKKVQAPLEREYGALEKIQRETVGAAEERMGAAQTEIGRVSGKRPVELAPTIRGVGEAEQKSFQDWSGKAYDEIETMSGGLQGRARVLREEVAAQRATLDKDLAKNLTQENKVTIDALEQSFDDLDKAGESVSIGQLNRFISQVKAAERAADDGLLGTVDTAALKRLKWAAVESRKAMTNRVKGLSGKLAETEREYAIRKAKLNGSILGTVMKKRRGVWQTPDEKVFDKVFHPGGLTDAKAFAEVLADPKHAAAKEEFTRSIYRKYLDEVAPAGQLDPAKHSKFMKDYGDVIQPYFEGKPNPLLEGAGATIKALNESVMNEKTILDRLNKEYGFKMRSWDPATLADQVWNNAGKAEAVKEVLKDQPAIWKGVQSHLMNRLEKRLYTQRLPGGKERAISGRALDAVLNDKTGKERERIATVFGTEYLTNLEMIRDAALAVQKGADYSNIGAQSGNVAAPWLTLIAKAIQLKAGPISKASRYSTRSIELRTSQEIAALSKVLVDPKALQEMVDAATTARPMRFAQMELANIIAHMGAMDSPSEVLKPSPAAALRQSLTEATRKRIGLTP